VGDSLPPPAGIDLVGSFARQTGADAELVLWEPKMDGPIATVQLRKGNRSVDGLVEALDDESGRRLVARVPRAKLSDGIWSVTAQSASGQDEPIDARLLVQARRPLVLLWGGQTTRSRTPKPRPAVASVRSTPAGQAPAALPPLRHQIAAAGGRFLDRRLAALPAERADKLRGAARRAARRVVR
jgi:hypothetical protein